MAFCLIISLTNVHMQIHTEVLSIAKKSKNKLTVYKARWRDKENRTRQYKE